VLRPYINLYFARDLHLHFLRKQWCNVSARARAHTHKTKSVGGRGRQEADKLSSFVCPTNALCDLKNNSIGTSPSDSQKSRCKDN